MFQVTHNQLNVLDLSLLEEGSAITQDELETLSRNMAVSLRQLIEQRDKGSEVLRLIQPSLPGSQDTYKRPNAIENTRLVQVILDLTQERDYLASRQSQEGSRNLGMSSPDHGQSCDDMEVSNGGSSLVMTGLTKEEKQHLAVELADTKSKLRRYRQEV